MNLFYHIFVPITCILDVQEGLCNFALKTYFDILHFIIYIHRNPEIVVFISQIITIKIVRSQLKNAQHLARLFLSKQIEL